jgi:hypothetical protein
LLLSRATEGEILFLYLVVSPSKVSSVLIREDQRVQKLVYFTSRALHGEEEQYHRIEKLALALIVLARRLRPNFQAHTVKVLTEYQLKKILQMPDISRRLVNWVVELGEFDIDFLLRTTIKGQALADFLVEFSGFLEEVGILVRDAWVVCVDGSSTWKRSGAGVVPELYKYSLKSSKTNTQSLGRIKSYFKKGFL